MLGWQKFPECPHMVGSGTDHWLWQRLGAGAFPSEFLHMEAWASLWHGSWVPVKDIPRVEGRSSRPHKAQPQNSTASFPPCSVDKESRSSLDSKEVKRVCLLMWKLWGQTAKSSVEWEMWFINHLCKYLGMLGWGECVLCVRRTWIWGRLEERKWTVCLPRFTC